MFRCYKLYGNISESSSVYNDAVIVMNIAKDGFKQNSVEELDKFIKENDFDKAVNTVYSVKCVELGFDIKSLSEILGHDSVNITLNRYVHPSMELKQKNMNMMSNLFAVK